MQEPNNPGTTVQFRKITLLCPSSFVNIENPLPQDHECKYLQSSPRTHFPESQCRQTSSSTLSVPIICFGPSSPPDNTDEFLTVLLSSGLLFQVLDLWAWNCLGPGEAADPDKERSVADGRYANLKSRLKAFRRQWSPDARFLNLYRLIRSE